MEKVIAQNKHKPLAFVHAWPLVVPSCRAACLWSCCGERAIIKMHKQSLHLVKGAAGLSLNAVSPPERRV